ncbi:hypothetical protein NDU88_002750 [Pleurodeles waltl]|uniref:Secreted protein n=1 Tax=Pleurodeles waltl TaxID=8319 RepID=A0AAV7VDQ8_PLEWA|nr:hypothetical protein NDU88_002750 [Pleurodeles waltl]
MIVSGQVAPLRRLGPLLQLSLTRGAFMIKVQLWLLSTMFPHGRDRSTGSCLELPTKAHSHLRSRIVSAGHLYLFHGTLADWFRINKPRYRHQYLHWVPLD